MCSHDTHPTGGRTYDMRPQRPKNISNIPPSLPRTDRLKRIGPSRKPLLPRSPVAPVFSWCSLLDRASSVVSLFLFGKFIHKRFRHPTKKAIQPFTKKAPYLRTVFTNDSAFHQEDDSAIHVFAYLRIQSTDYSAIHREGYFCSFLIGGPYSQTIPPFTKKTIQPSTKKAIFFFAYSRIQSTDDSAIQMS